MEREYSKREAKDRSWSRGQDIAPWELVHAEDTLGGSHKRS